MALSRGELDAEDVDKIIANLDKLGLVPWDKTQVGPQCTACRALFHGFGGFEIFGIYSRVRYCGITTNKTLLASS